MVKHGLTMVKHDYTHIISQGFVQVFFTIHYTIIELYCTWVDQEILKLPAYLCEYTMELYQTYTEY